MTDSAVEAGPVVLRLLVLELGDALREPVPVYGLPGQDHVRVVLPVELDRILGYHQVHVEQRDEGLRYGGVKRLRRDKNRRAACTFR